MFPRNDREAIGPASDGKGALSPPPPPPRAPPFHRTNREVERRQLVVCHCRRLYGAILQAFEKPLCDLAGIG